MRLRMRLCLPKHTIRIGLELAIQRKILEGSEHARDSRAISSADVCPRRRKGSCETSVRSPSSARDALEGRVTSEGPEAPESRQMVHCPDRRAPGGYRGGLRLPDSRDCGRAGHATRWL